MSMEHLQKLQRPLDKHEGKDIPDTGLTIADKRNLCNKNLNQRRVAEQRNVSVYEVSELVYN